MSSPFTSKVPAFSSTESAALIWPDSQVIVPLFCSVRPPISATCVVAESIVPVAVAAIVVVPAPVWVPPVQLSVPDTVRAPVPPSVPPEWVRLSVVEGSVVSVRESEPPEIASVPPLVTVSTEPASCETATVVLAGMHTLLVAPGTAFVSQFKSSCHELVAAPPSHVTLQTGCAIELGGRGDCHRNGDDNQQRVTPQPRALGDHAAPPVPHAIEHPAAIVRIRSPRSCRRCSRQPPC